MSRFGGCHSAAFRSPTTTKRCTPYDPLRARCGLALLCMGLATTTALFGCGGRPPTGGDQTAGGQKAEPSKTGPAPAPTPPDQALVELPSLDPAHEASAVALEVVPKAEYFEVVKLALADKFDDAYAFEMTGGGTPLVHVMFFDEYLSSAEAGGGEREEMRDVLAYHLTPLEPASSGPMDAEGRTLETHVRWLGLCEWSSDGLIVKFRETRRRVQGRQTVGEDHLRFAPLYAPFALPDPGGRDPRRPTPAAKLASLHQPRVPFSPPRSSGRGRSAQALPASVPQGSSQELVRLHGFTGLQATITIEHLPFVNPISNDDLTARLEALRAEVDSDEDEVEARGHLAWGAYFLAGRGNAAIEDRRAWLSHGLDALDAALRMEPANAAFSAARRRLLARGVALAAHDQQPQALTLAETLLKSNPTAAECETAALALIRTSPDDMPEARHALVLQLVRENLRLQSIWPEALIRSASFWARTPAASPHSGVSGFTALLNEFETPALEELRKRETQAREKALR